MLACSLFAAPRRARLRVLAAARLALSLVAFTAASFAQAAAPPCVASLPWRARR